MNKKVRILALALAVAVALVGAGYAAWGTEITSTTKMNSGEWKIVLEDDSDSSFWRAIRSAIFPEKVLFRALTELPIMVTPFIGIMIIPHPARMA